MVAFTTLRTGSALTEDQIYSVAPSVFQTEKHESRSDRFKPIATIDVLRGLEREGFVPVQVQQALTRDPGKRAFAKHLIRFRYEGDSLVRKVGDTHAEIVLRNGNDGSSSYLITAGLFRLVCLNGMVVSDRTFDTQLVRHTGDVINKVIEGTFRVLDQTELALAAPQDWARIRLPAEAQRVLAEEARAIRFGDSSPVRPQQLLQARRFEDRSDDLWQVWNRVQENVIKGGLPGVNANNRRLTTRAVRGIDQNLNINQRLWDLGASLAAGFRAAA